MTHFIHDLFDRFGFTFQDDFGIRWSKHPDIYGIYPAAHADQRARVDRPLDFMPMIKNLRWHRAEFLRREESREAPQDDKSN